MVLVILYVMITLALTVGVAWGYAFGRYQRANRDRRRYRGAHTTAGLPKVVDPPSRPAPQTQGDRELIRRARQAAALKSIRRLGGTHDEIGY